MVRPGCGARRRRGNAISVYGLVLLELRRLFISATAVITSPWADIFRRTSSPCRPVWVRFWWHHLFLRLRWRATPANGCWGRGGRLPAFLPYKALAPRGCPSRAIRQDILPLPIFARTPNGIEHADPSDRTPAPNLWLSGSARY